MTDDGRRTGAAALNAVTSQEPPPFAILHRPQTNGTELEILLGSVFVLDEIDDLTDLTADSDVLVLLPYRQIRERGYPCIDDRSPLLAMSVTERDAVSRDVVLAAIRTAPVSFDDFEFDVSDDDYEQIVAKVIADEIGAGEGSNFVISRSLVGSVGADPVAKALSVFKSLLLNEHGSYWTFIVHTGTRTFVGASPEAHVTLHDGYVSMNPISGTYRYPPAGPTVAGVLDFLSDNKETDELFMVVDEELKMMSRLCDAGGKVAGPFLKEMAHLSHTEYLLRGRTSRTVADVLRETMFAPTVMGSPLENASRVIKKYETSGRGYYSGAMALVDHDPAGAIRMDSTILIRTAMLDDFGRARIAVGSTLVRHSNPRQEMNETRVKAAALLGRVTAAAHSHLSGQTCVRDALRERNTLASPFWFADPETRSAELSGIAGNHALLIDAEDNFTAMLASELRALGLAVTFLRYDDTFAVQDYDLVVLGPGPGDPRALSNPRIAAMHRLVADALARSDRLLAVCLSHQILCSVLGLRLGRLSEPNQGAGRNISLFGVPARVGFYNTFVAECDTDSFHSDLAGRVQVSRKAQTKEVHALRGDTFESIQFHAESILSRDGSAILEAAVRRLLCGPGDDCADPLVVRYRDGSVAVRDSVGRPC